MGTQGFVFFLGLIAACSPLHLECHFAANNTIKGILSAACPQLPKLYVSNPAASNWVLGGMTPGQYTNRVEGLKHNNTVFKCPLDKPFSIGTKCIDCPADQFFNLKTKRCEMCPDNLFFDQKEKACTANPPLLFNTNPAFKSQNYIGDPPLYDSQGKDCPENAPFTNFSGCVQCEPPKFYNYQTLKCQTCPKAYSFDAKEKRCLSDIVPPIEQPRKAVVTSTPPRNGESPNTLGMCQPGYFYSPTSNRCVLQSSESKTNQLPPALVYLTSPAAPNLLFGRKGRDLYLRWFQPQKQKHPVCPRKTPYFNGAQCISCSQQFPLFDMQKRRCVGCPQGRAYDSRFQRCIERVEVTPTVERYLMNIK